ncbi:MAG: hypothetical protein GY822_28480 [Deltaproteobacteria bacterium]|nr:hypothetical protein [Deltaproteobacteria bacterium]
MNPISEQNATLAKADTRPHQVSACPVHFIWDGVGLGRPFVRVGFMGFMLSGVLYSAKMSFSSSVFATAAAWTFALSGVSYLFGQAFSAWAKRRR